MRFDPQETFVSGQGTLGFFGFLGFFFISKGTNLEKGFIFGTFQGISGPGFLVKVFCGSNRTVSLIKSESK